MPSYVILMLQAWGLTACLMLIFWLIGVKAKNAGWVDVGWTLGLMLCVWFFALSTPGAHLRQWLLIGTVSVWTVRRVNRMLMRFIDLGHEDKRYQKIRADWKTKQDLKFFFFFQSQAFLAVVLATCWLPSMFNAAPVVHVLEILGVLIWLIGFIGEIMADNELKAFFEWLMWVAYAVFALASPWGWVSFLAVALMYYFLMNVSMI